MGIKSIRIFLILMASYILILLQPWGFGFSEMYKHSWKGYVDNHDAASYNAGNFHTENLTEYVINEYEDDLHQKDSRFSEIHEGTSIAQNVLKKRPSHNDIVSNSNDHSSPNLIHHGYCQPKLNISFIKIHKTGSGSLHNVLFQMALTYDLIVALPKGKIFPNRAFKKLLYVEPTRADFKEYNLFFDHAVFNKDIQLEYMPKDTVFFTQIRHPLSQAVSALHHFRGSKISFTYLMQNENRRDLGKSFPITQNFQSFTLGYEHTKNNNVSDFKWFVQQLDSELIFVSILELNDESTVLLKRRMCWHIRDVLHIHTHKTANKISAREVEKTSQEKNNTVENLHRAWSSLDYYLYEYFYNKTNNELEQQPPDFFEELREYRMLNDKFSTLCDDMCYAFAKDKPKTIDEIKHLLLKGIDISATKFNSAFRLTYLDCLFLMSKEIYNKKVLKFRQYPDACSSPQKAKQVGLKEDDCDVDNHVYPGYHVKLLKQKVKNTRECLANLY